MNPLHAIEAFGLGTFVVLCCIGAGLGLCNLHTEALALLGGGMIVLSAAVIAVFVAKWGE